MSSSDDLDPSQFMERIRKLDEQRNSEDSERARKLEEEILQGRSERAARRAERQRSISPEKVSTPQSLRSSTNTPRTPLESTPPLKTLSMDLDSSASRFGTSSQQSEPATSEPDRTRRLAPAPLQKSSQDPIEQPEPSKPSPSPGLARSGTLSWQQRPKSRGSVRSRPLSMVAAENSAAKSPRGTPEPQADDEQTMSRSQIAQSLGAKDPTWFRQTAERGVGSAAYRKSQVEDDAQEPNRWSQNSSESRSRAPASPGHGSVRRQLPGMSRETTAEAEDPSSSPPDSFRSSSPSHVGSVRASTAWSNRMSSTTSVSTVSAAEGKNVLPTLESQRFSPPLEQSSEERSAHTRGVAMSPSQGRISPERIHRERTPSPTKGMGGFVQSAMLRRTDSQSKRWSAQPGAGPGRQSSTASNNGRPVSFVQGSGTQAFEARPSSLSRGSSLEPSSRPGSSHSNTTITHDKPSASQGATATDGFRKPALPHHSRGRSIASRTDEDATSDIAEPQSPSKRWSPTKSSWLESALNKPAEQPKPKASAVPSQPSWMADLKAKQQRESVDTTKSAAPSSPSSSRPESRIVKSPTAPLKISEETSPATPAVLSKAESTILSAKEKEVASPTLSSPRDSIKSRTESLASKPKPETPPKKDFRANLKPRQALTEGSKNEELEFRAAFGKLKRAETKNYKAPDTFKDNITRGKNDLAVTGGPKPRVRRDELKESLLARKEEIKTKVAETGSAVTKKPDPIAAPVPEGLARRKTLSRSEAPKERPAQPPPEALARQASLKDKPKPALPKNQAAEAKEPASGARLSKLADRFNPGLAGILAKGPSPLTSSSSPKSVDHSSQGGPTSASANKDDAPAKELTHMTKGRAKGPKRRAPTSKPAETKAHTSPTLTEETPKKQSTHVPSVSLVKPRDVLASNLAEPATPSSMSNTSAARVSSISKPSTPLKSPHLEKKPEKPKASPKSPELLKRVSAPVSIETPKTTPKADKPAPLSLRSSRDGEWDQAVLGSETSGRTSPSKSVLNRFSKNLEANRNAAASRSPVIEDSESRIEEVKRQSPTKVAFNRFSMAEKAKQDDTPLPGTPMKPELKEPPNPVVQSPVRSSVEAKRPLPVPSPKPALTKVPSPPTPTEATPERKEPRDEQAVDDLSNVSVKNARSLWGRQSASASPEMTKTKEPIKLPTRADERAAEEEAGLSQPQSKQLAGLGLGGFMPTSAQKPQVASPALSVKSRSHSPATSQPSPRISTQSSRPSPNLSRTDSSDIFAGRFDTPPDTSGSLPSHIDTQSLILSSPVKAEKIKTLRNQIMELGSDGSLSHIPIQEEHVLFEESMYLSTHLYSTNRVPKAAEVFLWIGSTVSDTVIEDAQQYGRQHAKENGVKDVTLVRQGKEPPHFFEALGGIIIVRRGSRDSAKKPFMLCGRRHFGHLAFDQVDLSIRSLCSGFPFVIAAANGSAFLWTGLGCSAEELAGARLIAMDLAASGELVEVPEGSETEAFLDAIPDGATSRMPRSADHWRYKAGSERYRARLFRVSQSRSLPKAAGAFLSSQVSSISKFLGARRPSWQSFLPAGASPEPPSPSYVNQSPTLSPQRSPSPLPNAKSEWRTDVTEIAPFGQSDLEGDAVFVLDAFFEIYIILLPLSTHLAPSFSTALFFAQDFALLAASIDDRPFIPVATVVLDGAPRDMKACFRNWDERLGVGGSAGLMAGVARGRSLRVVGLARAMGALR